MHPCALYVGLGVLQGRKRSVLCVCCCDCDRGAVLVVCVVVVVLWCARWSSLALVGVQKHRGVLICRRGHRKHDNDPQSGGTGEGKYRQNKRQRKFLTSAGFPSVWCLSGVPEGLLIAGDHQTSIQTRGKSNSPPSRSRPRQRERNGSFLFLLSLLPAGFLSCHWQTELQQTPRPSFNNATQVSTPKATSLPSCSSETRKCNPYGSRRYETRSHYLPR